MEPMIVKRHGRELGNAAAAAAVAGVSAETYRWYVRTGNPEGNPAPGHVATDDETGHRLYAMKTVRAWMASRTGRGNWGGDGARARERLGDAGGKRARCPDCRRRVGIRLRDALVRSHLIPNGEGGEIHCTGIGSPPLAEPVPPPVDTTEQDAVGEDSDGPGDEAPEDGDGYTDDGWDRPAVRSEADAEANA